MKRDTGRAPSGLAGDGQPARVSPYPVIRAIEHDMLAERDVLNMKMVRAIESVLLGESAEKSLYGENLVIFEKEPYSLVLVDDDLLKGIGGYKYLKKEPTGKFDQKGNPEYRYFYELPSGRQVHAEGQPLHPSHATVKPAEMVKEVPFGQVKQHPKLLPEELAEVKRGMLRTREEVTDARRPSSSQHFDRFLLPLVEKYIDKHWEATHGEKADKDVRGYLRDTTIKLRDALNERGINFEDGLLNEDVLKKVATDARTGQADTELYEGLKAQSQMISNMLSDPGLHREYMEEKRRHANKVLTAAQDSSEMLQGISKSFFDDDPLNAGIKLLAASRAIGLVRNSPDGRVLFNNQGADVLDQHAKSLSEDQRVVLALARKLFDENHHEVDSWMDNGHFKPVVKGLPNLDPKTAQRLNQIGHEAGKLKAQYDRGENWEYLSPVMLSEDLGGFSLKDLLHKDAAGIIGQKQAAREQYKREALDAKAEGTYQPSSRLNQTVDFGTGSRPRPPLRERQKNALNWMDKVKRGYLGGAPGFGKTRVVIEHIAKGVDSGTMKGGMIFTSPSILNEWENENRRWHSSSKAAVITGSKAQRIEALKKAKKEGADLILFSIGTMNPKLKEKDPDADWDLSDVDQALDDEVLAMIRNMPNHSLYFDEAHKLGLKNENAKTHKIVRKMLQGREHAFFLSGTPIKTDPEDIYHQIDLLHPGAIGQSRSAFERRFKQVQPVWDPVKNEFVDVNTWKDFSTLHEMVAPYLFFQHRLDPEYRASLDIPEANVQVHSLDWAPEHLAYYHLLDRVSGDPQAIDYDKLEDWLASMVERPEKPYKDVRRLKEKHQQVYAMNLMAMASRLKADLSISPKLIDPKYEGPQPVIDTTVRNVINHFRNNDNTPYIVASSNIRALQLVKEELLKYKVHPDVIGEFHGQAENREAVKQSAQTGEGPIRVVLLGTEAGGAGLNLQRLNNVDVLDQTYSPADMDQLVSRVDRPGQENHPNINFIQTKHGFMETIRNRSAQRVKMMNAILLGDKGLDRWHDISKDQIHLTLGYSDAARHLNDYITSQSPEFRNKMNEQVEKVVRMLHDKTLTKPEMLAPDQKEERRKLYEQIQEKFAKDTPDWLRKPKQSWEDYVRAVKSHRKLGKLVKETTRNGSKRLTAKQAEQLAKQAAKVEVEPGDGPASP